MAWLGLASGAALNVSNLSTPFARRWSDPAVLSAHALERLIDLILPRESTKSVDLKPYHSKGWASYPQRRVDPQIWGPTPRDHRFWGRLFLARRRMRAEEIEAATPAEEFRMRHRRGGSCHE
jgi:hypothetical protein